MTDLMTKLTTIFEEVRREQDAYLAANPDCGAAIFDRLERDFAANDNSAMGRDHYRQRAINAFIRQYDAVITERNELLKRVTQTGA